MKKSIGLFLILFSIYSNVYAAYEKDGMICSRAGRHKIESCREPKSQDELNKVHQDNAYYSRINYCDFSMTSSWSGEIEKVSSKIKAKEKVLSYMQKEVYWARQDISKQAVLPSDTLRSAYDTVNRYQPRIDKYESEINWLRWCLRCAQHRKSGATDCQNL